MSDEALPIVSEVEILGPFQRHMVILNGYPVPYLEGEPATGGKVFLHLDHRYSIDVDVAQLDRWVDFIANCIAVASGFTCHPGTEGAPKPIPRSIYHRMYELGAAGPTGQETPT